jgi:hypothetical protein
MNETTARDSFLVIQSIPDRAVVEDRNPDAVTTPLFTVGLVSCITQYNCIEFDKPDHSPNVILESFRQQQSSRVSDWGLRYSQVVNFGWKVWIVVVVYRFTILRKK